MQNPEFSFIIPSYNCGQYLAETIESILCQENYEVLSNVQIIIVNDGSTDNTALVAESYAGLFPDTIVYIEQENAGASAARLTGLAQATGTYVNFLDADDKWSLDVCSCMHNFFEQHADIPICAAKHLFFGAKEGKHPLGYKFDCDTIVDLRTTCDFPQLSWSNLFIKRELIKPEYADNRLSVSEDFLIINRVLMGAMQYGILRKPTYWYRKRDDASSAIDQSTLNLDWYTNPPRYCYQALFDDSLEHFGRVMPFLQYAVMYDLQWRIKEPVKLELTSDQLSDYRNDIVSLLKNIADEIILGQRNLTITEKLYALSLKHGLSFVDLQNSLFVLGSSIYLVNERLPHHLHVSQTGSQNLIFVDFITPTKQGVRIEGRLDSLFSANAVKVCAQTDDWTAYGQVAPRASRAYSGAFDASYAHDLGFTLDIPYPSEEKEFIEFQLLFKGHALKPRMNFSKFSPLTGRRFGFALLGDYMLTKHNSNTLVFSKIDKAFLTKREGLFEGSSWFNNDRLRKNKNLKYRRYAFSQAMLPKQKTEKIWLFMDRPTMAGDNAEALFRYLQNHPVAGVKPYFVLNADSPDFKRMQQYGNVVAFDSPEHIRLQIKADKIIAAAADDFVFNRLQQDDYLLQGLESYKYVFLQHGVIKDDMSDWLNRFNKNIALFVTSSPYEWHSVVDNPAYGYNAKQVALTGLPRHDKLLTAAAEQPVERMILIAPTWRHNLAGKADAHTGKREENPGFEASGYYQFYQGLLNNERLLAAAKERGFGIRFLIHPALAQEAYKFSSPVAKILTEYHYTQELVSSAIMVTDFSSVIFDFALLKKPLLYSQFDEDTFYKTHMWDPGYFSYRENGFGDVTNTIDETVEKLCNLMKNPVMPEKYQKRVDDFFYWPKTSRCEELLQKILEL